MQDDWIQLQSEAIDAAPVAAFVADRQAGGIALFLGTTRAETSGKKTLSALDYEAYPEMALKQMKDLAARARERWPIHRVAILHRMGRVDVGKPSVVIGVSTAHRAQAFEACRWIIDTLKQEVAIWKKEVWADGTASWVHPDNCDLTRGHGDAGTRGQGGKDTRSED